MKIGLWGYGKMGKQIEETALQKGHEICWKVTVDTVNTLTPEKIREADVVIEFTNPHAAPDNVKTALDAGVSVVTGSTGWYDRLPELTDYCRRRNGALFYASNFSIGVNLFFRINSRLASWMEKYPEYRPYMEEIHHTQKLDAPSGTAITLAHKIAEAHKGITGWKPAGEAGENEIPVKAIRKDEIPGTHTLVWEGPDDRIVLTHEAFNRVGFASGAVLAAEWLIGKKGVFTMDDLLPTF